jgi:hypothetical protein
LLTDLNFQDFTGIQCRGLAMSRTLSSALSYDADAEQRDFQRICDLAESGHRIPRVHNLLRGCPFLSNNLFADAKDFAGQMVDRLAERGHGGGDLHCALAALMAAPTADDFLVAAAAFEAATGSPEGEITAPAASAARCHFYATMSGHAASIHKVAAHAVTVAYSPSLPPTMVRHQIRGTVAWLLAATNGLPLPQMWTRDTAAVFVSSVDSAAGPGRRMIERMMESRDGALTGNETCEQTSADRDILSEAKVHPAKPRLADGSGSHMTEGIPDGPSAVVISTVGNSVSSEGRRVFAEFEPLIGESLPLTPVPDLAKARKELVQEFPHADEMIDVVLRPLSGLAHVKLPPTLFVGPPGCGKTTFTIRLTQVMGLPFEVFNCGGVSDAALSGTPRRWSTGEACLPLSLVRTHRHAGPAILLDELDKAATSPANGSLLDGLHALLDPRTAGCFRDPYVEAPVNLTNVTWLGTVNSLKELPRSLTDRCRVLAFPAASAAHLEILARNSMRSLTIGQGLDPRWAVSLDGAELSAIAAIWKGGSLRSLSRMVQAVVAVRERYHAVH